MNRNEPLEPQAMSTTAQGRDFPRELALRFVPMQPDDLPAVLDLERRCFPSPWSEGTYRQELRNHMASYWVGRAGVAHPPTPPVLSYAGLWLLGEEAHVTTIAVHPDWRRRHLGEWTLLRLLAAARDAGADLVTLEVRVANAPAIALYHKLGFVTVGLRRGYYRDTGEDARLLTLQELRTPAVWTPLRARLDALEQGPEARNG